MGDGGGVGDMGALGINAGGMPGSQMPGGHMLGVQMPRGPMAGGHLPGDERSAGLGSGFGASLHGSLENRFVLSIEKMKKWL
jgi:hypothetical protein